ncbi:MAG: response [Planctomycetota bacterium]|nr:MAG: response [Planctomycetota bacterium]
MSDLPPRHWKPGKPHQSEPPAFNRPAVALLRVLLVDNLASWRAKMKSWITEIGAKADDVLEASTGDEALELIAHEQFNVDAIVAEFDDESVNASELLAQIRSKKETAQIGFVAMCGNDPAAIREARSSGANEVLVKPVTVVTLLSALSAIQRTLKPRTDDTRRRLQEAASQRPQSTKMSSTIAQELRAAGKLGKYSKLGAVIAAGPFLNRLYWVEQGTIFVRETRADGTVVEYRATPGRFFGEAAFVGEKLLDLRAVTETPLTILGWQEAEAVAQTMQRLPILTHYFKTITTERHRNNTVGDMPDESAMDGMNGSLESLPFPDLIQMIGVTKKTGTLRVDSAGDSALLHVYGGIVKHAECGNRQGDSVLFRICTWAGGRFSFSPQPDLQGPHTVMGDAGFVIMEGLRRRDAGTPPDT